MERFAHCLFLLSALTLLPLFSALSDEGPNQTLSPYLKVLSGDRGVDTIPLRSTEVDVNIAGVIADVKIRQVYKNGGKLPVEAIYVFPGSTRSAVYRMNMKVEDRLIEAKIEERKAARTIYEQAKIRGQSASLLEQQRPNVFQMNVTNILPGDEITVELGYTELLIPTDRTYEFVYPTVVGPRYSTEPADSTIDRWVNNPFFGEGESTPATFDIDISVSGGIPIGKLHSDSHEVEIKFETKDLARVKLKNPGGSEANRDFILKYRLADDKIKSGVLLFEGEEENFFLLMAEPPKRVEPEYILPREYIFIVDVSGSMHGFPLSVSKELMRDLLGDLRPEDRFNVLLFASSSSLLSPASIRATPSNIQRAIQHIDQQRGGGGTNLLPAMKRALALPGNEEYSRSVIIATDGFVSVETQAFDLIREHLNEASFFSFGIGSSVNRHIIEGIARTGKGESFIVTNPAKASDTAKRFREYVSAPVLTEASLKTPWFKTYDVEPPTIPDLLAERPVVVIGKWRGRKNGSIVIEGLSGEGRFTKSFKVKNIESRPENAALRYLWARTRIRTLSDYNNLKNNPERTNEVTRLGLKYNLLTQYTSFLAVDSKVRNTHTPPVSVTQPLPLSKGVTNHALSHGQTHYTNRAAPASANPQGSSWSGGRRTMQQFSSVTSIDIGQSAPYYGSRGFSNPGNYNDTRVAETTNRVFAYIEGSFGALVMLLSALLAIVVLMIPGKKLRRMRVATSVLLLLVSSGMFTLRALVASFFNDSMI